MKSLSFGIVALMTGLFIACGPQVTPEPEPGPEPGPGPDIEKPVDPNVGDFALEVKSLAADYVELLIKAPYEVEMAFQVVENEKMFSPAVLFKDEKNSVFTTVAPGDVIKLIDTVGDSLSVLLLCGANLHQSEPFFSGNGRILFV